MKRIIAILLSALTLFSLASMYAFADTTKETSGTITTAPATPVQAENEELPSSFTLVGTPDLPPVMSQGSIGCCASAAITYMQFTNAVSRYIREYMPDVKFEPATGDKKYLFSPKWTYDFAGSGTAWVYNILTEMGCVTQDVVDFYRHPKNGSALSHQYNRPSVYMTQTTGWHLNNHEMEQAFDYRVLKYEQIWISKSPYLENGKVAFTTSKNGQALLQRIKETLNAGNVVVTGGMIGAWKFSDDPGYNGRVRVTNPGKLGKKTDKSLIFSRGNLTGGHQVCIVGYDDDFSVSYNGATMKGAFQMVNSWDNTWKNGGYVWVMYDALNEVSEHEKLNFDDRVMSIDQFCFLDWRTDLLIKEKPHLYMEVEVEAKRREEVMILPSIRDVEKDYQRTKTPFMFKYSPYHSTYDELKGNDYFNFEGKKNGDYAIGTYAFDYSTLINYRSSRSHENKKFGFDIFGSAEDIKVISAKLKNNKGEVLSEIPIKKGGDVISGSIKEYEFDVDLTRVDIEGKGEGYTLEKVDFFTLPGTKVPFKVVEQDGYNYDKMVVKDQAGNVLQKDENGCYVVEAANRMEITVEGVEVAKPAVDPENKPSENAGSEEEQGSKTVIIIVSVVAAVIVVAGIVAGIVVGQKMKKKK